MQNVKHAAPLSGTDRSQAAPAPATDDGMARPSATPPAFAGLAALLPDVQAAAVIGVSVRKFHDLRDEDWMPRPIVLGPRLLRWSRAELEAAIMAMPRAQGRSEPAQLARARAARSVPVVKP
jgi:predicted DNA-binding transcriptional regulator AlpA